MIGAHGPSAPFGSWVNSGLQPIESPGGSGDRRVMAQPGNTNWHSLRYARIAYRHWETLSDVTDTLCGMNDPAGPNGPGQPADQPFAWQDPAPIQNQGGPYQNPGQYQDPGAGYQNPTYYQDPAAGQQGGWPGGYQQPAQVAPAQSFQQPQMFQPNNDALMSGEPVLVTIGDISVTSTTVYTPSGSRPLAEVSWTFTDLSTTSQAIPTWAIICAIVFFVFCFLGLLFLLAKEDKTAGSVQVTVHGPGFVHTSTMPVTSIAQVADINARVNYVRTLTASTPQIGPASQPGDVQGGQGQTWQQNPPAPGQDQQPGQSW